MDELSLITLAAAKSYTDEHGGGGGGTDDYNDLKNQPKINNNTLVGNKTASDLGLASEEDLEEKQDVLTAGNYVSITNDGTINVTKAIGVYDNVRYVFTPEGGGYYMRVEVYINDVKRFEQQYQNTEVFNHVVIMELVEFWYGGDGYYWHYKPLIDSREHAKDIVISWYYTEMDVHEETFDVPQDDSTTLATKGDIDAAVSRCYHHAGTKTCAELVAGLLVAGNEGNVYNMTDSGTTTADFIEGAGQPIKAGDNVGIAKISDGVYKFDLLSGFVDTTNFVQKSVTAGLLKNDGTVNDEIEDDVDSLKSGLTNVEDDVKLNTQDLTTPSRTKNLLPLTVDGIKAANTDGTWSGNSYAINNGIIDVLTDADLNVTGIKLNGTFNNTTLFYFDFVSLNGSYIINGCPSGGSATSYRLDLRAYDGGVMDTDIGNGANTGNISIQARCVIRIENGTVCNNIIFKPMIRLATETDPTFAPYIPSVESRIEAVETYHDLGSIAVLPTLTNNGFYCFMLSANATVGTETILAGTRFSGYHYGYHGFFTALSNSYVKYLDYDVSESAWKVLTLT